MFPDSPLLPEGRRNSWVLFSSVIRHIYPWWPGVGGYWTCIKTSLHLTPYARVSRCSRATIAAPSTVPALDRASRHKDSSSRNCLCLHSVMVDLLLFWISRNKFVPPVSHHGEKATCCRHTQISSRDIKVVICYYSETRVSVLKLYSRQWCTKISISRSIWGCMTIMRSRRSHRRVNQSCSHPGPKLTARLMVMITPQSHRSQPLRVASECLSCTCSMQSNIAHEVICK